MTMAEHIIEECRRARGVLSVGESTNTLAYDAAPGALTSELRAQIVAHKADIIQTLFEWEERAAMQDAPEWIDARLWSRAMNHPAVLKLQSLGLCHSIEDVRTMKRESEAA
jgi:hypothetical protein